MMASNEKASVEFVEAMAAMAADPFTGLTASVDGAHTQFPFRAAEVKAMYADAGRPAPPLEDLARAINCCRNNAEGFFVGPRGLNGLPEDVRQRFLYLDKFFNSSSGWKADSLLWWFENVAAVGAPDFVTPSGEEIHLCRMSMAAEVQSWLKVGFVAPGSTQPRSHQVGLRSGEIKRTTPGASSLDF